MKELYCKVKELGASRKELMWFSLYGRGILFLTECCPSIAGLIIRGHKGALHIRSLRILSLVDIELALPLPSGNCDEVGRDP